VKIKKALLGALLGAAIAAGVPGSAQASATTEHAGEPAIRALDSEYGTESQKWGSSAVELI
jgi:hypothetical protein